MPSHPLHRVDQRSRGDWLLQWDDQTLTLRDPGGDVVLMGPRNTAHRLFDLHELHNERRVVLALSGLSLTFEGSDETINDVANFIAGGLRDDPEYVSALRRRLRLVYFISCVLMAGAGSL